MQEFNLEAIWKHSEQAADGFYNQIKPNIAAIVQQKSQSILASIHRNTLAELAFGFVLLLGMSMFLWDVPKGLLLIFVLYSLITLWISFQFWLSFRRKASQVYEKSIKESIQQYIDLLQSYKTHLWNYSISLIPFTVFIGFVGGYCKGSNNNLRSIFDSDILWISGLTIGGLMFVGYYLLRWYFQVFLDAKIEELERLQLELGTRLSNLV